MTKLLLLVASLQVAAVPPNDALWQAAREGDTARIIQALERGADVNAKARYDVTALTFAAINGRLEALKLLVARGADLNVTDTFYRARPAEMALTNGHAAVTIFLLESGAQGADNVLMAGVQLNNGDVVKAAAGRADVRRETLQTALTMAERLGRASLLPVLNAALATRPGAATAPIPPPSVAPPPAPVPPTAAAAAPTSSTSTSAVGAASAATPPTRRGASRNWPSFRGEGAAGNGDGQGAISEWDVATGKNIKWKTPIPGIATSSPVVWGNRVFLTTSVSSAGDKTFRTGLYGDVKPADDRSSHSWKMYSLDKATGKVIWEREAFSGTPQTQRHPKASQANSTPATDGRRVVALFGSVGLLVAWDMDGKPLWRADLGTLDSGWFFDPTYQWGHSSSPIIYRNSVIVQADMQKGSYLAAYDLGTGKQVWKALRSEEISTWGTPAIVRATSGRDELVTNGTKVRGYDPSTGALLWTLGPNSEITIATPVAGPGGLVYVTGGYPPVRPIYAVRAGAKGDISLPQGKDSSDVIAWSNATEGTYIPTPLVYGDYLYTLNINGIISAYELATGKRAFRGRAGVGGSFSASPVAADGKLYIASEDGDVYVVSAGSGLAPIATNTMKEVIMATPAISDGLIIIRTLGHVYGIGP